MKTKILKQTNFNLIQRVTILLLILMTIFFTQKTMASDATDYNLGYNEIKTMLGSYSGSNTETLYRNYLKKITPCSLISGTIYHAGDSRFPRTVCLKMLGAYDAYHNKVSSFSKCTRETLPSDIVRPSDLFPTNSTCSSNAGIITASLCAAKTINLTVGTAVALISLPQTEANNTVISKANNDGASCGTNSTLSCSISAQCDNTGLWNVDTSTCVCQTNSNGSGSFDNLCTGTPPRGRTHCRCGRWVTWEVYKRTYEC